MFEAGFGLKRFGRARRADRVVCSAPVRIDALEARLLFSAIGGVEEAPLPLNQPPIVVGATGSTSTGTASGVSSDGTLHPLTDVPLLHSYPAAGVKIYLDFDGAPAESWGDYSAPATPAYDIDRDPSTFSDKELANIREIWARVSEKFSPFNVDVTTEDPGSYAAGQAMHEVIGGDGSWINSGWGGATFVGGFATGQTDSFIFSANLTNGDPHNVAEATAHEIGHAFGLQHQSIFDANGVMIDEYNSGTSQAAPIMGRDYNAALGLWWDGPDQSGATDIQDDMAIIASARNGFGYRPEDHGQTIGTADVLTSLGPSVSASGVISTTSDTDTFSFTTGAGVISFKADVAPFGPMLDLRLTLLDGAGNVIASADTASLAETLTATVPQGQYFVQVASHGNYGDVGQYTLTGTIVAQAQPSADPAAPGPITKSPPPAPAVAASPVELVDLTATSRGKHSARLEWNVPPNSRNLRIQRSFDGKKWITLARPRRHATAWVDRHARIRHAWSYRIVLQAGLKTEESSPVSVS